MYHSDPGKSQIMKHLGAYLLLRLGGNDSPSAKDIKDVLSSVGIDADDGRLSKLLAELKGKDLNDVCFRTCLWNFHFSVNESSQLTNPFKTADLSRLSEIGIRPFGRRGRRSNSSGRWPGCWWRCCSYRGREEARERRGEGGV